jgi:hypothetical protein
MLTLQNQMAKRTWLKFKGRPIYTLPDWFLSLVDEIFQSPLSRKVRYGQSK